MPTDAELEEMLSWYRGGPAKWTTSTLLELCGRRSMSENPWVIEAVAKAIHEEIAGEDGARGYQWEKFTESYKDQRRHEAMRLLRAAEASLPPHEY